MLEAYIINQRPSSRFLRFLEEKGYHLTRKKGQSTLVVLPLFSYAPIGIDAESGRYSVLIAKPRFNEGDEKSLRGLIDSSEIVGEGNVDEKLAHQIRSLGDSYNQTEGLIVKCEEYYRQALINSGNFKDKTIIKRLDHICDKQYENQEIKQKALDMALNRLLEGFHVPEVHKASSYRG